MPRKEKKYHYIYRTINLLNNKYYIGMHSTDNLNDGYMGSGKYLKRSIRKYGKEKFKVEILEHCENRSLLSECEKKHVTKDVIKDKCCMNLQLGGEGFNTIGMATIKNMEGVCFNVFIDDPRYLSGELVGVSKGTVTVKDENGKTFKINVDDPRYLSGELVHVMKGLIRVKDEKNNRYVVFVDDPRYLSGELVGVSKGTVTVKDENGNVKQVSMSDDRYLSGELVGVSKGYKHTEDTKSRLKASHKKNKHQCGSNNSQYGKRWIYSIDEQINQAVFIDELPYYLDNGWNVGRVVDFNSHDKKTQEINRAKELKKKTDMESSRLSKMDAERLYNIYKSEGFTSLRSFANSRFYDKSSTTLSNMFKKYIKDFSPIERRSYGI